MDPVSRASIYPVFKDFVPRDGTRIQFRIETFNLTNRTNFGNPGPR